MPATRPAASTSIARVLVVPWSNARMYRFATEHLAVDARTKISNEAARSLAATHGRELEKRLPGTHVHDAGGEAAHVRLGAEHAAQVEVHRVAGGDVRGAGRPGLLALHHVARGVLDLDADLRGRCGGAVVDQFAAQAEAGAGRSGLEILDREIGRRAGGVGGQRGQQQDGGGNEGFHGISGNDGEGTAVRMQADATGIDRTARSFSASPSPAQVSRPAADAPDTCAIAPKWETEAHEDIASFHGPVAGSAGRSRRLLRAGLR